jgi:hypothetical protein
VRKIGGQVDRFNFDPIDSIKAELEAFATSIASQGKVPYPISTTEMNQTIGLFEAIVKSIDQQSTIKV